MNTRQILTLLAVAVLAFVAGWMLSKRGAVGRYQLVSLGDSAVFVYRLDTTTGQIDIFGTAEKTGWTKVTVPGSAPQTK